MRTHTKLLLGASVVGLTMSLACTSGTCEAAKKKAKVKTYKYSETRVACDTRYEITEFYGIHLRQGNKLKKNLGNAKVKWSCSDANVKVDRTHFSIAKPGTYKLVGKSKKKKFVVPLKAYEKELKYDASQTTQVKIWHMGNVITVDNKGDVNWMLALLKGARLFFDEDGANNQYVGCNTNAMLSDATGTTIFKFDVVGHTIYSGDYKGECNAGLGPYIDYLYYKYYIKPTN